MTCQPMEKVTFWQGRNIQMKVPKKFARLPQWEVEWSTYNNLSLELYYLDGAIIYVCGDFNFRYSPSKKYWMECSTFDDDGYMVDKCEEGIQDDGRFWKEIYLDDEYLVLGY